MIRFILPALLAAFLYTPSFGQNKLTGSVRDQQQKEPIEGVHVFVPELRKGTITDGEGRFVLRNLPDGHFKVQFTHIGYENIIRSLEMPASTRKVEGNLTQQYHSNTDGYVTNLGVKGTHNAFFWGLRGGLKSHADYISGTGHIVPNTQYTNQSVHAFTGLNKPFGSFKLYYDFYSKDLGMSVPGLDSLVDKQDRTNKMWYQDLANHMILSKNAFYLDPFKLEADLSFQSNHRQLFTRNQTGVDMLLNTFSADIKGKL